jgi:hypothetical protein
VSVVRSRRGPSTRSSEEVVDKQSIDSLPAARTKREKNRIARLSRKQFAQFGITETHYLLKLPCTVLVRGQYRLM